PVRRVAAATAPCPRRRAVANCAPRLASSVAPGVQHPPPMMKTGVLAALTGIAIGGMSGHARGNSGPRMAMVTGESEPADRGQPTAAALGELRDAVAKAPRDREARFALVRGLMRAGQLGDALTEAKAWRAIDAYNLVVVRLIGDIDSALGRTADARRAYSAV